MPASVQRSKSGGSNGRWGSSVRPRYHQSAGRLVGDCALLQYTRELVNSNVNCQQTYNGTLVNRRVGGTAGKSCSFINARGAEYVERKRVLLRLEFALAPLENSPFRALLQMRIPRPSTNLIHSSRD